MDVKRFCETVVPVAMFVCFIVIATSLFFLREPVILVCDGYFSEIYGAKYDHYKHLEASFRIFKGIKVLRVTEETDSLSICEAVQDISQKPAAVFFAYAYLDAADFYAKTLSEAGISETKIFVFMERNEPRDVSPLFYYVQDDADMDYFRAGVCAGLLSFEDAVTLVDQWNRKPVVFVHDSFISEAEKRSFSDGLKETGFTGRVDFSGSHDNRNWGGAASVVLQGASAAFFQSSANIPAVLFSWFIDANYLPSNIKVLVDDSPYYLIPRVLKMAAKADESMRVFTVPSKFVVLKNRISDKNIVEMLTKATQPL